MKKVTLPKKEFVKEHKHLVKLLRHPTKKGLTSEAKAQAKELKKEAFASGFSKAAGMAEAIAKLPSRVQIGGPSRKIGVSPKALKAIK